MKPRTLQQRLLAAVLISAIPVFAVHFALQVITDLHTASARAAANTQDIAAAAIPLLQSTLIVGDLATAQETLDNIMRHGQFRRLRLLDGSGSKLLAEGRAGRPAALSRTPEWFVARLDLRFPPQQFVIAAGGSNYGTLLAEPSPLFLVADIWQRMWTAVSLWLSTLLILLVLLGIILRRGLRPLDDLAATAHRFGNGDLDCRAQLCAVPELAATARAFNRMAENLAEAQDRLEARVLQRTLELSASEARTSAILANLLDGVLQTDAEGTLLTVNEAVCRMFDYRPEELLGQPISRLIPEVRGFPLEAYLAGRPTASTGYRYDVDGRHRDGSLFSLDLSANELAYDHGSTWISVLRDISQQKQAAAAREAARANAEELAQAKSEFLANMSHEIRTPLNAMLGLTQVGLRKSRGRQIAQTFARILQAGDLLLCLINDILDFSKIEAHKLQLETVPFALATVIDRAVDLSAARAFAKGLNFVVSEAADLPGRYLGDPVRLSQVLLNLLSNAVKFTQSGSVSLHVERADATLLFRISDSGMGMSAELMNRLFEPFEQADSSITRRFGGSGLGLVISRRLLALMGGELQIASQPGLGTRIEVRLALPEAAGPPPADTALPLRLWGLGAEEARQLEQGLGPRGVRLEIAPPDRLPLPLAAGLLVIEAGLAGAAAEALRAMLEQGRKLAIVYTPGLESHVPDDLAARCRHLDRPLRWRHLLDETACGADDSAWPQTLAEVPRLAGIRILAAEDDAANRLVLQEILALEGASLVVEENGLAVCERLAGAGAAAFDVLITDIQMPLQDGYATARRLREIAPGLPVIGLSAHAMPEERARCRAAGMVDLITKPVAIDVLVASILRHLQPAPTSQAAWADAAPQVTPARPAAGPGIDWPALEQRFNGNTAFVHQLAATVLEFHAQTPARLRAAAAAGDFAEMAALSHQTGGMGVNILAGHLADLAHQAEEAARRQLPPAAVRVEQLAATLEEVLGTLTAYTAERAPATTVG
ncbi:MAG: hypothetical protein H6R15_1340 [Proteobacteria bacterium]|nr:hypothetical protein [Pseudomonadota bacterium]